MTLRSPLRLGLGLVVLSLGVGPAVAADGHSAPRVVFRGARNLEHALRLVTYDAWRDPSRPRPVAIVVDATPFTAFAAAEMEAALVALDEHARDARSAWRIGRLGGPLARRDPGPAKLSRRLRDVLSKDTQTTSTFHALRRTLARFRVPGGVVVYVADRHFEDHAGLEAFVAELKERDQRFFVVGPEAGFQQPYDDTCFLEGRGPFGPALEAVPWHTGDTAWPHLPGRVTTNTWYFHRSVGFPVDLADRLREYAEQERRGHAPEREAFVKGLDAREVRRIALSTVTPSSFGPYGLMRACAETGGTYCLWSWNPLPRPGPTYDYGRCNLFAPDLRTGREIRADLARRPLVQALVRTWDAAASHRVRLAAYTPPVREDGLPQAMKRTGGGGLPHPWRDARSRDLFLLGMARRLDKLDLAIDDLERTVAAADDPDAVDRRYRADADLWLHVLRLHRFQEAEKRGAFLAFEAAPPTLDRDERLTWQPQTWVRGGPSPDTLRLEDVYPHDLVAARQVLAAHREFLERYRGTPYAELLSRNQVHTYRIVVWRQGKPSRGGRGRSSSRGRTPDAPVTPGPGGSTGGGPTTGR